MKNNTLSASELSSEGFCLLSGHSNGDWHCLAMKFFKKYNGYVKSNRLSWCFQRVLLLLSFLFLSGISPFEVDELPGAKAPEFTLRDINGNFVSITALRGNVIVLNFWATWCPPCKDEMPSLNSLYNQYKDRGLEVLALATNGSVQKVKDFLETTSVDFTVLFDKGTKVARQYKVYSIPTTFLIDRSGLIVERYLGETDWTSPEVTGKIEELLR